jgi:hypothetical protein
MKRAAETEDRPFHRAEASTQSLAHTERVSPYDSNVCASSSTRAPRCSHRFAHSVSPTAHLAQSVADADGAISPCACLAVARSGFDLVAKSRSHTRQWVTTLLCAHANVVATSHHSPVASFTLRRATRAVSRADVSPHAASPVLALCSACMSIGELVTMCLARVRRSIVVREDA